MKSRLKEAGLLCKEDDDPEINISFAWSILAQLGYPARYGGRAQDGSYEYVIVNPETGDFVATGKGVTLETSMCQAALNASPMLNSS